MEIGAERLPTSINDILEAYPNIILIPFTEFKELYGDNIPDSLNFDKINARIDMKNAAEPNREKWKDHIEAFTEPSEEIKGYFIYFDDRIRNEPRLRWSIGHEMGHIFDNHFIDFDLRSSNFVSITDRETGVLELEAHWFASEIFAPGPFMCILKNKLTAEYISLLCDISSEAASKRVWQIEHRKYKSFPENNQMMLNFSRFIFDGRYWDSVYRVLRERFELHPRIIKFQFEVCRVCKSCGAIVHNNIYSHCQYCGEKLDTSQQFRRNRMDGVEQPIPEGKAYPCFEENKRWRALFCPRCKNYTFSENDEFCPVCQTPLYNRCLEHESHDYKLSLDCRRCPDCGGLTVYSKLYDELKGRRIPLPSCFKGYYRYEDWGYIRFLLLMNSGYSKGMNLYAILSDSAVYTDYDNFVLVFAGSERNREDVFNSLPIIKSYIESYGSAHIKDIYLYHYNMSTREIYRIMPNEKLESDGLMKMI